MIKVSADMVKEMRSKLVDYHSRMMYDIRSLESLTEARIKQLDEALEALLKGEQKC